MPESTHSLPRLVVIDMQVAFAEPNSAWACEGYENIENRIAQVAEEFDERVVYTKFVPDTAERGQWARYYDQWPEMRQPPDSPIWDLTIQPPSGAPIVSRPTFSKWGHDLATVVGPTAPLALCGVATECCVLATALAAADAGRKVIIVSDCCRGATYEYHNEALSILESLSPLVTITTSDAF